MKKLIEFWKSSRSKKIHLRHLSCIWLSRRTQVLSKIVRLSKRCRDLMRSWLLERILRLMIHLTVKGLPCAIF